MTEATDSIVYEKARLEIKEGKSYRYWWDEGMQMVARLATAYYFKGWRAAETFAASENEALKARNAELEAILAQPAIGFAINDSTGWLVGIYLYNAIEGHLEIDPGSTVTELIPRVATL